MYPYYSDIFTPGPKEGAERKIESEKKMENPGFLIKSHFFGLE